MLPRARTLEGFALETGDGIDVRSLGSGTTLLVHTRNTFYRLVGAQSGAPDGARQGRRALLP